MGLFTRSGNPPAPTQASEPPIEASRSLGLEALMESLHADRKYSILDLGQAVGANIEFYSRFASRIRIEDLYQTLVESRFFERGEDPPDETVLGRIMSFPSGERFDIVMSWDLLNYLTPDELKVLLKCLNPFFTGGTLFFALISTLKEMPAYPRNYRILDAATLQYCAGSTETRACPRFAPRELSLLMSDFRIHNSYMLRNGMQEYVFVHQ